MSLNAEKKLGDHDPRPPTVSVIVPTYNESWHLAECLQSLCDQDQDAAEIILVDNGSTDQTRAVCSQFARVKYVYYDGFQSSYAARNEGARQASGDVLLFFDADQTARRTMIREMLSLYQPAQGVEIVVGRLDDDPRVPLVLRRFFSYGCVAGDLAAGHVTTAVVAVSRRLFEQLGGFVPQLLSGGDLEFFGRAVQHTAAMQTSAASGYHYWARDVSELYQREQRFFFGKCLRASHAGQPPPAAIAVGWALVKSVLLKSVLAATVPLRYRRQEWGLLVHAQWVATVVAYHRLLGVLKFHRGHGAAGDCPVADQDRQLDVVASGSCVLRK